MINSAFEKYYAFKDSGIDWLGDVPSHWAIKRLKDIGSSIIGITYSPGDVVEDESEGILVLRASNIQDNKLSLLNNVFVKKNVSAKQIVRKGDILLCSRSGSRSLIGKNICIDEQIEGSTFGAFMTIYRSRYFEFIAKFFNSKFFESQSGLFMTSTINQLTIGTLNNLLLALPPLDDQKAIAAYLDEKTAVINYKIDLLTQKAEQYKQLKQSLINQTVTRGLDKTAPLKDSGIEWLGQIPAHWQVSSVTNVTTVVSIKNHPDETLLSVYRDYGVIIKSTRDDNHNKPGQDLSNYKLVEPGFLVLNKMKTWQGSLGVSAFRGIVSPAYITCKTDGNIVERRYLHHLLRCCKYIDEYNRLSYGVRIDQWDMRYHDFKYVPLLLPPLAEQKAIADYLDTKTAWGSPVLVDTDNGHLPASACC
jgi:type I restriction enzyme, S subunit